MRRSVSRFVALPPCSHVPAKYQGPTYEEVAAKRAKYVHPVSFTNYSKPIMLTEGHRQYLWDEKGNRFLDLFGGVTTVSVGHSHPRITKVVEEQAKLFNHTTLLYLTSPLGDFAEKFASKLPKGHDWVVHVVNSGSEANDFAMLMSRVYTKNFPFIGLRNGYHGFSEGSRGLIAVPNWKHNVPPPPGQLRTLCPHPYHGVFGDDVNKYLQDLDTCIKTETGGKIAGFIAERIQGVGGAGELLPGYLRQAYDIVKAAGGLYVSDEVQCGYGRLGSHYWGFETEGIVPDIITSAKSIANGFPVGVVATKREIAESMKGVLYFNTFGGGAICSRVARETLQIIDDENLQQNCAKVGKKITDGLKDLQKEFPIIGHIRGKGCMQGFEFVKDPVTKVPATAETVRVMEMLKDENILVGKGGPAGNVIRLHPPMVITEQDVDAFLTAMRGILPKL